MANIAIFLDGTWNDPEDGTSVHDLMQSVDATKRGTDDQQVYYASGVGIRPFEKFRGAAFGMGLSKNILDAYSWLVDRYNSDDKIFIFGFSRGAYTARSLAGLIARCGLLRQPFAGRAEPLFDRYKLDKAAERIDELEHIRKYNKRSLTAEEERLLKESRRVDVEMIGVWDTVGSLGIPWSAAPFFGPKDYYFHNTRPSKLYKNFFQALALDEYRGPYLPTLWTDFVPKEGNPERDCEWDPEHFEQRWFIGAHANVGGGYGRNDALRNPPLVWLQQRATALGLRFNRTHSLSGNESSVEPARSYEEFMYGLYRVAKLGKRSIRTVGRGPVEVEGGWSVPVNETIDGSVFDSCRTRGTAPQSLAEWARRKSLDLATLRGTQKA